jgi:Tfp pilus assembly ATPase PilU
MLRVFRSLNTPVKMARLPLNPLIAIVGATGTGKSDVSIATVHLQRCENEI